MGTVGPRRPFKPDIKQPSGQPQLFEQSSRQSSDPASSASCGPGGTESQSAPGHLMAEGSDRRSAREKFNIDTRTGAASCSVLIQTSPGRSGFQPSLELVYNSGSAGTNGVFGLGWSMAGVDSISRKTSAQIPTYDNEQDVFVHSSMGDLVLVIGDPRKDTFCGINYSVRQYRPRVESDPIRVERWSRCDSPDRIHWKTISSGNVTTIFGPNADSQVFDATFRSGGLAFRNEEERKEQGRCFSWLASERYDGHGNHMAFHYKAESPPKDVKDDVFEASRGPNAYSAQRYLKSIKYGNTLPNRDLETWKVHQQPDHKQHWLFEVILDYGEHTAPFPSTQEDREWPVRPDAFSVHTSGFEIRTYRRCRRVLMFHHFPELKIDDCLVAATAFQYQMNQKSGVSMLESSTAWGYSPSDDGKYTCLRSAPSTFEYWEAPELDALPIEEMELDLSGFSSTAARWVDLNGDGSPGVICKVPGGPWYYHANKSSDKPAIGGPELQMQVPCVGHSVDWTFEDLTGDGQLNVVFFALDGQLRGLYERGTDGGWSTFTPLKSYPSRYPASESHKVDLNGNGLADILYMVPEIGNEFVWYPSLGKQGYGAEKRTTGAPGIPTGAARLVTLSDMDGSGLSDIVIITNSQVCYWPNMGYGQFGPKVVMGNPPFLGDSTNFSPLRIRMVDITGSGSADLIYLHPRGGIEVYYNHSGNKWSDTRVLPIFPPLDSFCAVDVIDIPGRGTNCLCWTSDRPGLHGSAGKTSVRFIDLMGGTKPGLMTKTANGIGCEVELTYQSSTRYCRDDERGGMPWATQLPFPVHCVQSMVEKDLVAETASTTEYAYHNGHYDHHERQFRGFQMVEEWTKEDFAPAQGRVSSSKQPGTQFYRPTVHTKRWFYIGLQQIDTMARLPGSYHDGHSAHTLLPSSVIYGANNMRAEEVQDAYRALAGHSRRQEIYSIDESPNSSAPYLITEQTYGVTMRQAKGDQEYGVFRVNAREQLNCNYERALLEEPRVTHSVFLETDDYGNVCSHVSVDYGISDSILWTEQDKEKQQETIIIYTKTDYTNAIDCLTPKDPTKQDYGYFQIPLPAEVRQYRAYPISITEHKGGNRYSWEDLAAAAFEKIPEHDLSVMLSKEEAEESKILISKHRTLYSGENPNEPLQPGRIDRFSIPYQSYQLAFSKSLLDAAFTTGQLPLDTDSLERELREGGYKKLDGTDEWWSPSTRSLFVAGIGGNGKGSSRDFARTHFYLPNAGIDQYGNVSYHCFDKYGLLPNAYLDPVNNTTSFENDYVHLQPTLVTSPNNNRAECTFDPYRRPVAIAMMGKKKIDTEKEEGDCLLGSPSSLSEEKLDLFVRSPLDEAKKILANATKRIIYNDRYKPDLDVPVPAFRAELVRDTHYRDPRYMNVGDAPLHQIGIHITYLNGHGEPIQTVSLSGNSEEERQWQFSNSVILDSKGQPVRQVLPFTASTHHFRNPGKIAGISSTTFLRDALERDVAQLNPDRTWSKTRFTPWSRVNFDAGDTIEIEHPVNDMDVGYLFKAMGLDSGDCTWYGKMKSCSTVEEKQATCQSKIYDNTPSIIYIDPAGRQIVTALDNNNIGSHHDKRYHRTEYDAFGNISSVRDALNRIVTKTVYDFQERPLHTVSMDTGHSLSLPDCNGAPLLSWQNKGPRKRIQYDGLRRQKKIILFPGTASETCVVEYVYGEETNKLEGVDALERNLKGKLYQCRDQSGKQTNHTFDFKGNCTESWVQYAMEYRKLLDWSKECPELDSTVHRTTALFDALGHQVKTTAFEGATEASAITRTYDVAGRLKKVGSSTPVEASITNIEYCDDNQVMLVKYKNGTCTTLDYDEKTRQRIRTRTKRLESPRRIQDISYTYDCVGRIVRKADNAQQTVLFSNSIVQPMQEFSYDALGQLINASGREQIAGAQKQLAAYDACSKTSKGRGNGNEMIRYEEVYSYDKAGNIEKLQHRPQADGYQGWTRTYAYTERSAIEPASDIHSNRLSFTISTGRADHYKYDDNETAGHPTNRFNDNGCITSMPGYSLAWNYDNKLRSFSRQNTSVDNTPETTWYIYNAQGERVRKVTDSGASGNGPLYPVKRKETRYLPLRDIRTCKSRETTTLHIGDSSIRHSPTILVETTSEDNKPEQHLSRYQISDQVELDDESKVISYEEFSPFGVSTYQTRVTEAPRKYRFARYQRDSESGLYLCGERYYAPWLGRWISADPLDVFDGLNLYQYVANDPVNLEDPQGMESESRRRRKNKGNTRNNATAPTSASNSSPEPPPQPPPQPSSSQPSSPPPPRTQGKGSKQKGSNSSSGRLPHPQPDSFADPPSNRSDDSNDEPVESQAGPSHSPKVQTRQATRKAIQNAKRRARQQEKLNAPKAVTGQFRYEEKEVILALKATQTELKANKGRPYPNTDNFPHRFHLENESNEKIVNMFNVVLNDYEEFYTFPLITGRKPFQNTDKKKALRDRIITGKKKNEDQVYLVAFAGHQGVTNKYYPIHAVNWTLPYKDPNPDQ